MRRREWVTTGALFAAIAIAIFAVGGAFRWAQALVALAVVVAIASQVPSRRVVARLPRLLVLIGAAIGLTLLQMMPMPGFVLEHLQPIGAPLRTDGAALLGIDPSSAITLDPAGSLRAVCFFVILGGAAWAAVRYAVSESGRYRLLAAVAVACGATALIVALHEVVGAHSLYGLYEPEQARPSVLGPLLNENHLGGLMAVGTMTAFGLAMHARQRSWMRALWIGIVLACGVTTVASQSRGATFALITGALVTGGTLLAQKLFGDTRKRSRQTFLTTSLPIGVVVACAIIVIVYASAGGVSSQLGRTTLDEASRPTSKVAIWRSTVKLATEAPILGVGRGAFEPAFTRVHGMAANYSFSHVENEYLQVVVEWGVIGMLVLGFCGVWLTLIAFKRWRDGPLVAGALGAVAAVALQSIVDFGIELLGVAIPTTIVLATLTYVPLREEQGKPLRIARVLRMALAVIVFAVGIALLTPATRTIADDHDMLAERDLTLDEVRESVARHPLDYYGYARGAQVLRSAGDPRAVQLLNHALQLHPTQPGLHHMAADMLYRAHRLDQSALEYAAALRATATRAALLAEIVKRFTPALVVRAIPSDLEPLSEIVRWLTDLGALDIAIEWLDAVLQEHPRNRNACEQLFTIIVNKHVLRAAEIASRRCTDISHEARIMIGHMLMDKQRFDEARSMLGDVEDWPGHIDTKAEGWLIVCDTLEAQKKWDEAKRCLRRLDSSGNVLDQRRGEILMRLDRITESLREQELPKP